MINIEKGREKCLEKERRKTGKRKRGSNKRRRWIGERDNGEGKQGGKGC